MKLVARDRRGEPFTKGESTVVDMLCVAECSGGAVPALGTRQTFTS